MHPDENAINDYIDDVLGVAERATIEQHVKTCDDCRALEDDLREVRRAAASLEPMEPPLRAWTRLERAIRHEHVPRPYSVSWKYWNATTRPYWVAAAAVLLFATVAGLRFGPPARRSPTAGSAEAVVSPQSVEAELQQAETHYQKAIAGLEQIANADRGALDPQTAATLQKNLAVIDQAIGESRAALKTQPNSEPAQQSLFENFKSKIALLQDTVALVNEMRKGNEVGAARIVSGLKQQR